MSELAAKKCVPCRGGVPPLTGDQIAPLAAQVPDWQVVNAHHLVRRIKTRNFADALALVNKIGALAEEEGHHPELKLGWGHVDVEFWTHKIDGLTESDFIMAAKVDRVI
jgi:4a-hydroxytetrahydrobiopterin dehydratase